MSLISYDSVVFKNYTDAIDENHNSRDSRRRPLSRLKKNSPDYVSETLRSKIEKALPAQFSKFSAHYRKIDSISVGEHIDCEPPSSTVLSQARLILRQLESENLEPTNVVASAEGGVAICFGYENLYADIECLNAGEILGVVSNRRDRPTIWQIDSTSTSIARAVAKIRDFLDGTPG